MSLHKRRSDILFYFGLVAPGMLLFVVIVALPVFGSIALGFTNYNIYDPAKTTFAGFDHYANMLFKDPNLSAEFWRSFQNNMVVIAVSVFGQIPLGFLLGYLLYRKKVKGTGFFQAMVFLPNFIATIVIGLLWKNLISPIGPVTALIRWVTGDPNALITWQLDPSTAMIPVIFALLWMYTGFYMVIFQANFQRVDPEILEAAMIDGASESKIFFRIVTPLMTGVIIVNMILAIAGSLKGFDLIFAMTGEGISRDNSMVLPIYMYKYAFRVQSNDAFSFGSAISNVIIAISVTLIMISSFIHKKATKAGGGDIYEN